MRQESNHNRLINGQDTCRAQCPEAGLPAQLPGPTPGDETPSQPHGAGNSNRTALIIVAGVVVAVVVVALLGVLTGDDGDDSQTAASATPTTVASTAEGTEPVTTAVTATSDPSADTTLPAEGPVGAGDVADLEVIEEGFSTYTDPLFGTVEGSFGFLIENTGDATIVAAPLSVTIKDEGGGTIQTETFTVGVIRPRETLGYGTELIENPTNGIGDIEVQIGESVATYDAPAEGTLTVSDVSTTDNDGRTLTTFIVESTYSEQVDYAEPYAIYRDADGRIIGGGEGMMAFIPPGGQQTAEVTNFAEIPNIATTEAYVDPGPFY